MTGSYAKNTQISDNFSTVIDAYINSAKQLETLNNEEIIDNLDMENNPFSED